MSLFSAKVLYRQLFKHIANNTQVKSNLIAVTKKSFSIAPFKQNALRFTDKHEWINLNGNIGTIGITEYAQDKLGEVVYAELPAVGAKLAQADQFATLESVKAVSECYVPVAGKVVEINESIKETPSQINKSPFDQGWLIKIEVDNKTDVDKLMSEAQYKEYLKSEDH